MPRKKTRKQPDDIEEKRTCLECYKVFKTKKILTIHTKREHENHTYYSCDQCDKSFKTKYYLKTHKTRLHSNEVYAKCERCNKTFKTRDSFKTHMIQVHTDGMFVCDDCRKCFKSKWYLIKHIQNVHCNIRYACTVCKKSVKYKHLLQCHYNTYHAGSLIDDTSYKITLLGELFQCNHCPQKFESEKFLVNHASKKHRNVKSIISRRRNGMKSKNENNDVKVKSEPDSDNSIDIADIELELNDFNNEDTSNDTSRFVCDYCQKELKHIQSLQRHIGTFHSETYYCCRICKRNVQSKSLLQEHNDISHSGMIVDETSFKTKKICKVVNNNVEISEKVRLTEAKSLQNVKNTNRPTKVKLVDERVSMDFDDIDLELKREFGVDELQSESEYLCSYFKIKEEIKSEMELQDCYDIDVGPVILQRPDVDQFDDTEFVVD